MQKEQSKKLKFTYNEQREYESIEDDIAGLEEALEKLDEDMAANATNSVKLGELLEEKKKVEQTLEEKMERWEHLEDLGGEKSSTVGTFLLPHGLSRLAQISKEKEVSFDGKD